jgi:hypothetical protein
MGMKKWIVVSALLVVVVLATLAARHHHVSNVTGDSSCVSGAVCAA